MFKFLVALFVFPLLFTACAPLAAPPTATPVPSATFTPLPSITATPTPPPPTATVTLPTATFTPPPPSATNTFTPTTPRTSTPIRTATRTPTATLTRRPSSTPIPTTPAPDFSKLGSGKIVFSSQHYNPAAEISLVDLKANKILRLIGNLFADNIGPRLSPDGTRVVFASPFNGSYNLFTLKVDEATLKGFPEDLEQTLEAMDWLKKLGITQLTWDAGDEFDPTWSPDGKFIAYTAKVENTLDLYILSSAGGQPVRITQNLWAANPDWSPDGQKLVFEDETDGGGSDIAWIPIGGGSRRKLTGGLGSSERSPVWSPDGTRIAYCGVYDYQSEIAVMNADGSSVKRLTHDPASDCNPAWSPDGSQIIFVSKRSGFENLYIMDASDGGNLRQLTFFNRKNLALNADWGK